MVTRFSCLSDAVMFATRLREEGGYAELIHLNAGHLWGPMPDWGIPVVHSDLGEEPLPPVEGAVPGWLSFAILGVPAVCFSLVIGALLAFAVECALPVPASPPVVFSLAAVVFVAFIGFLPLLRREEDEEVSPPLHWLPESLNRAMAVVLAISAILVGALGGVMLLGLLAGLLSVPLMGLRVLLDLLVGSVALGGTVALGHLMIRAHRDPVSDLHSAVVVFCHGWAWLLICMLVVW